MLHQNSATRRNGKGVSGGPTKVKSIVNYISDIEIALVKVFLLLGTLLTLGKWLGSEIYHILK